MNIRANLKKRMELDEALYEKFGQPLESKHFGEFVAINQDGQFIISENDLEVLQAALERFGSGNFAFRRIGYETLGKWRSQR